MGGEEVTKEDILKQYIYERHSGKLYQRHTKGRAVKGKEAGIVQNNGYKAVIINKKKHNIHRLIWILHHGKAPAMIDHINRNRLDNRISNLRLADASLNSMNRVGKGWVFTKGKYKARITVNKKVISLGVYSSKEEARQVYLEAKARLHAPLIEQLERSFNE